MPTSPWTINDFDFGAQPTIDEAMVRELGTCSSLDDATNVLFIGPPGVGKTMLAIALGHAAVDAGHRVYYTTAADLAARCRKAALEGRWAATMRFFNGPSVLIVDELGFLPMPTEDASALLQVIARRFLKGSIGARRAAVGTAPCFQVDRVDAEPFRLRGSYWNRVLAGNIVVGHDGCCWGMVHRLAVCPAHRVGERV